LGAFIGVLELFDNAAAREMSLRDEGRQDGERVPRKEVVDTVFGHVFFDTYL